MYKIINEKQNDLQRIKLFDEKSGAYVSVIAELGANVNEIVLNKKDKLYSLLDGRKSKKEFQGSEIYNSALLFPFPNRIMKGRYEFEGASYQLPINWPQEGHAIHGFVCDKVFNVSGQQADDSHAEITLVYDYDASYPGYPFPFQLKVTYRLENNKFFCTIEAHNTGINAMPVNVGWHPYFSINGKIDNIKMQLPSSDIIVVDNLIPTGEKKPNTEFIEAQEINGKEFDTCFSLKENGDFYETKLFFPDEQVTMVLQQDSQYKYLQIYTPPQRESIALEPMTGNVNNFNNKKDLIVLKAGEKIELNYAVYLQ